MINRKVRGHPGQMPGGMPIRPEKSFKPAPCLLAPRNLMQVKAAGPERAIVRGAVAWDEAMGLVLRTVTTTPTRALVCVLLVLALVLGAAPASQGRPQDRPPQGLSLTMLAQHHECADRIGARSLECPGGTFGNASLILLTSALLRVLPVTYSLPGDQDFPSGLFLRDFFRPPRASIPA